MDGNLKQIEESSWNLKLQNYCFKGIIDETGKTTLNAFGHLCFGSQTGHEGGGSITSIVLLDETYCWINEK